MMNVIVIPARSGSQRLKNKNLLMIGKKTLIEKTIIFSKKIRNIDKIIVSSNDLRILSYEKKFKDIYFIKRPKVLSSNNSLLIHTIKYLNEMHKKKFENILILQPTSPFRSEKLINKNWLKFIKLKKTLKSNVSVSEETVSKKKKFLIRKGYLIQRKKSLNNQKYYEANGNFFMINIKFMNKFRKFVKSNFTIATVIDEKKYTIDIDTKKEYIQALRYR